MVVERGQVVDGLDEGREPRSAIGLDRRGRRLILVVVDGRQTGYSEGANLAELGNILINAGAYLAMNLDGGGSSTLVVENASGQPEVLNSPIDGQITGRERPVGNHLGILVKSNSK
jgi:exopolysaccharide biosynthesis protein